MIFYGQNIFGMLGLPWSHLVLRSLPFSQHDFNNPGAKAPLIAGDLIPRSLLTCIFDSTS
jgi:hypothetical protein